MEKLIFLADDSLEFSKALDCLESSYFSVDDVYINATAGEFFIIFEVENSTEANILEKEITALFVVNNVNGFFELN